MALLESENAAPGSGAQGKFALVSIRLPVALTFAALVGGLLAGIAGGAMGAPNALTDIAALIGGLWLRALQMTIIPLVAALLVLGLVQMIMAARVGTVARRMLAIMVAVQLAGGAFTSIAMPALLRAFPVPEGAGAFLAKTPESVGEVPGVLDFMASLVSPNIIAAAAETAMLPLTLFFVMFAVAITRLPEDQGERLLGFFHALGNVMLLIIGWVLGIAPIGVFALAYGVGVQSGGGAFAALGHYVLTVTAMGTFILALAYGIAIGLGRTGARFATAVLPAQAVALSTQSSLASLPAMLDSAGRLSLRASTAEFVLPLAVVIFRATSAAMNLAVVYYIAALAGVEVSPTVAVAGILIASVISLSAVSLPGSISFVVSIGPIALAMGVPVEPLALLVAVEMLPDLMRTLGNVTMNVAVTSAVDRAAASSETPKEAAAT
ncbi:cation:dicarboxylase symporter family transporter [Porphyrobacter sp. SLTP]|uniref:dicarboxylate/amino acid:cation symporter n=1 Tax=Porphyrobacter sp. SLTP TaxID=2683266 RepID=UPI001412C84E|nr:cation:dicarboxylase symporter family transporter [Porphyrobacter sp. SLTP]NBB25895.1 cation:dicarboxylase symporter family transporter [Porphyrobacter sp. SLTP]